VGQRRRQPVARPPRREQPVCTQIGNDTFAWFGTTGSKRSSELPRPAACRAIPTMRSTTRPWTTCAIMRWPGTLVQRLVAHQQRQFADETAWLGHLEQLGLNRSAGDGPTRCESPPRARCGGAVSAHGFPVRGGRGQRRTPGSSNVGQHALCWIHAERLVHKLETFTDQQRRAQQHVRGPDLVVFMAT